MNERCIRLQRQMANSAQNLHQYADALVYELEEISKRRDLDDDEDAALTGAHRWRALIEGGIE